MAIGWTHFSVWRLWFTCKALATVQAPSSEIWLPARLQNVREEEMRGASTKIFNLCKVYLVSVSRYWDAVSDTVCPFVSYSSKGLLPVKLIGLGKFMLGASIRVMQECMWCMYVIVLKTEGDLCTPIPPQIPNLIPVVEYTSVKMLHTLLCLFSNCHFQLGLYDITKSALQAHFEICDYSTRIANSKF